MNMQKIQVRFILEILGKPQEHVAQALQGLIERISNQKGIKILDKAVHEPVLVKDSKDLYTSFAEITAELDAIEHYFAIIFSYFPAHIELISPTDFSLPLFKLNEIGNFLVQRLHEYDSVAKTLLGENTILKNKLQEVAPHLFAKGQPQASITSNNLPASKKDLKSGKRKSKKGKKN